MASVTVEFNMQSDTNLASKSTRPHVSMDLVPLNDVMSEKNGEVKVKCSHFSIRGYVSEVRKRDPQLCNPFSLKDTINNSLHTELPPMEVPKFRWWRCISCVPEASVSCASGKKEVQRPDKNADNTLALVGEFSKINIRRERNGEASTSIDSNDNRNGRKNVVVDPKGKGKIYVDVEPVQPSVCENGFLNVSTQRFLLQTTDRIEVSPAAGNQVFELGSKFHDGTNKALQKDSRECQVETLAQESVNRVEEYASESCQEKSQAFLHDRLADSPTYVVRAEVVALVHGPRNDCKGRLLNLPDLNECSGEPLYDENTEALINKSNNNEVDCEDDDDYLGAECRKNPKVRLLSELLGLKETQISTQGRKKTPSLTGSFDENVKRKRVGSSEEGSKSTEIRVSDSGIKKLTRTTESSESDSEYASDSDTMSTEIISKTLAKRRCKSRIPLLEKRNKKTKVDYSGSSINRQKIIPAVYEKGKTSENLPPKSDVADKLIERSLVKTKKRGKLCQVSKEGNSLNACKSRVPKDFAATQKDENAEKRFAQKFQTVSENDFQIPRNLVNYQACVSPEVDGPCPSSQSGPMLIDGNSAINHQENRYNVRETSVAFRTTDVGALMGGSFDDNGECSVNPKTIMKDKKTVIPEAEVCSPLVHDMRVQASNSVANQKEHIKEVRRRIHDIDINSIPIDDRVTDDIPMDIVELMAKNQYERHRSDHPKETPCYPTTPENSGKYTMDTRINGSYGEYWPKFGQSSFLTMQRPPSNTDRRNSMVHGNLGFFSDFSRNSLKVSSCHPRENTVSARFLASNQAQEHSSAYPPCGLTLNSWNGNINMAAAQSYPPNYYESYRVRACTSRHNITEAAHVWPSVVASQRPLGINNPQMISQSSNVLNKGNFGHHQTSGSILNFNTPGPTSLGKQRNLNFSNGCSNVGGHSESSGDMYSNDAVSAMHLLSLMQNAARMQNASALSLGPLQNVARTTSSRHHFVEDKGRNSSAMQENPRHPCYPTAIPTARKFSSSFQTDGGNIRRNSNNNSSGFVGPIPLTLRGQRNMESSHFALPSGDHHPQRRPMGSSSEIGRHSSAISPPVYVNPLQRVKDAAPNSLFAGRVRHERIISPAPEKMVCKLNQNPSEFNDLKELSRYMIGPDDLRPRGMARHKLARPRGDVKRQEFRPNKHNLPDKEREKQRKVIY